MQQPKTLLAILSKMAQKPEVQFDKLFQKLYNIELWLLAWARAPLVAVNWPVSKHYTAQMGQGKSAERGIFGLELPGAPRLGQAAHGLG